MVRKDSTSTHSLKIMVFLKIWSPRASVYAVVWSHAWTHMSLCVAVTHRKLHKHLRILDMHIYIHVSWKRIWRENCHARIALLMPVLVSVIFRHSDPNPVGLSWKSSLSGNSELRALINSPVKIVTYVSTASNGLLRSSSCLLRVRKVWEVSL